MSFPSHTRFFLALSAVLLLACGAEGFKAPEAPGENPGVAIDQGPVSRPPHPDKQLIGQRQSCDTWEQQLQVSPNPPRWGLPADSKPSLHVNGLLANLAKPSPPFTDCILADIFKNIDAHVASLRTAWTNLSPDAPGRPRMVEHLGFLYDEPQVLALLKDMALNPVPLSDREEDIDVRFKALDAIAQTAPSSEHDQWKQALFAIAVETTVRRLDQWATFKLRDIGVDEAQFRQGLSGRLPQEKIDELAKHTIWPQEM